ncbi:MAG: helix-turn-helix domain-containing protein [Bacteroidales bacterium]|nr:helix-turn-helix domain-containing protein [Bacteroidales bacterium]
MRETRTVSDVISDVDLGTLEPVEEDLSLGKREQALIEQALKKHAGNRRKAAEELGVSERTIYRKIKEYSLLK